MLSSRIAPCAVAYFRRQAPTAAAVRHRAFAAVSNDTPKKILAVLYRGGEAAKNPRLLGCLENELGLRKFLEDRGHTLVVTDDKEGADSQFEKELEDADVVITTPFFPGYLTPERIKKAPKLKLALTAGIGSDHVDLEAASEAGITVAEVTGSNVVSVAEHVVMMILSLVRNYIPAYHQVIDGEWNIAKIAENAYDLEGKIVGTVGAGRIGQRVLQRLKGFDCAELLYSDYAQLPKEVEEKLGAKYTSLEDMVKKCDVVTINCPLHKGTRGLFDQTMLTNMKKGAYLVNTARGAIVDRDALVKVLESGHLAGYAGDVWYPQPAPKDHPWRTMPNHAMTPHYSGTTLDAQARYAAGTKEILRRTFDNEPLNETDVIVQGGKLAAQYDKESKGERNLAFKPEWEKLQAEKEEEQKQS
ncbi:g5329 [Coccomyxa viridis]|uniref:Formate dehydrogenase, mitochondrial n=1 Tax=Coccomyxa viridis TaxID=1274662 RepID=A0ABP1FWI1_9CHLO